MAEIQGSRELARVLRALPKRLEQREYGGLAGAWARGVAKEAADRAPRGSDPSAASKRYGALHENVRATKARRNQTEPGTVKYFVHNGRAFWGLFLEFGTSRMPARPWFTPAVDAAGGPALQRAIILGGKRLEKLSNQLAGEFGALKKPIKRRL